MFNLAILDKAKSIVSGDMPTAQRVQNGAEVVGAVADMAGAAQARSANPANAAEARGQLMNTQAVQTLKTAASAVASYFTGGLSAVAQNVGLGMVAKNNPQAAGLAGVASKVFGG
jgi:hypothetical protein